MGYATRPDMVAKNAGLLSRIKEAIDSGSELKLSVKDNSQISSEQYRLRRILAACDNHPLEYGGEFARLGQRVSLKIDGSSGVIICSPRGSNLSIEEYRATEHDAISFLTEASGNLVMIDFFPSERFDLDSFLRRAEEIGWNIVPETRSDSEDGKISFAAERKEDSKALDLEEWMRS